MALIIRLADGQSVSPVLAKHSSMVKFDQRLTATTSASFAVSVISNDNNNTIMTNTQKYLASVKKKTDFLYSQTRLKK